LVDQMSIGKLKYLSLGASCLFATLLTPIASAKQIMLERDSAGIVAELQDADDYYYLASGKKQKLYRKKDVYVMRTTSTSKSKKSDLMGRFKASYGSRVSEVKGHSLGRTMIVKVDNGLQVKVKASQNYNVQPEMLKRLDASIVKVDPVFSLGAGKGDLMLLPRLTFALEDPAKLKGILKTYGLSLHRKLKLSDHVYSSTLLGDVHSASDIFRLVRGLANEPGVSWAEPQFHFKPVKAQYTPNDSLFSKQWHLRDDGYRGSRCDTDCDADNAWDIGNADGVGAVTGLNTVVAVIDDGVELSHPDLAANIAPNGFDFVEDATPIGMCLNGASLNDGTLGPDSDPSPKATTNCVLVAGEPPLQEDNHGTAVAGVVAAVGDNSIGVSGVAYSAKILPIRAISDFDQAPIIGGTEYDNHCSTLAEAFEYSAQYADVINASWQLPIACSVLETALDRVTSGTVTVGVGSKRVALGSPVVFASGNDASGWVKVTIPVTAGEHAYEWRYLRPADPDFNDNNEFVDQTAWLDDIVWPDGSVEGFESISTINEVSNDFSSNWVLDSCNSECTFSTGTEPIWSIETDALRVRGGTKSAHIQTDGSDCGNSYLHIIKDGPAGSISFWVWASLNSEVDSDKFEFLVDGKEVLSYGDLAAFGFKDNDVAYPASLSNDATAAIDGIIAVGASTNGDLSGLTGASLASEERAPYSQFGPSLDVVAPSSNQHVGIVTTDRTGSDGYNTSSSSGDLSDLAYTQLFMGTSASAAVVSGVSAAIVASNSAFSAEDVKQRIINTADKIGTTPYTLGRNDYHGYGRVNMYRALENVVSAPLASCAPQAFDFSNANDLMRFETVPQPIGFCPARGPLVPRPDELCLPLKSATGKVVVICL
jgi:hypothetical protein